MQDKKYIAISLLIGLTIVGVLFFSRLEANKQTSSVAPSDSTLPVPPQADKYIPKDGAIEPTIPIESQADYVIDVTAIGFSPESLKVKKGDSVIWTSRDR